MSFLLEKHMVANLIPISSLYIYVIANKDSPFRIYIITSG